MSMLTWLTRGPKTRSGASSGDTESLIEESLQETNASATDKGDSEVRSKSLLPTRAESTPPCPKSLRVKRREKTCFGDKKPSSKMAVGRSLHYK